MAIIKLSVAEQRRASAFFTCLLLAVVVWVIVTLSNTYDFTVKQVVSFKNAPQKRAFHSLQSDTVSITEKGTGWQMLFAKMKPENRAVKVDLQTLDKEDYVVLTNQLNAINEDKDINNRIVSFSPDTLYFDFSNFSTKRVPVQLSASLKYQRQYAQSDNVTIKPAYVTVSGPSSSIEKITVWKTDSLSLKDLDETVNSRLNLEASKEGNISIYPKSVEVTIPVNEFTEKTIEVPVKLVNNYSYYNVKVFPQKVKVTFTTSLNKYANMDEELFEAEANLDMWTKHNYSVLPVMVTKLPQFCKVVKIEPQNIDFIIKK
jgi:YbbR domain-containing protein